MRQDPDSARLLQQSQQPDVLVFLLIYALVFNTCLTFLLTYFNLICFNLPELIIHQAIQLYPYPVNCIWQGMKFSYLYRYKQLLEWSRTEDLSRIAKCRAVYHSGFDKEGVPVVVCVGRHFPTHLPEHKVSLSRSYSYSK